MATLFWPPGKIATHVLVKMSSLIRLIFFGPFMTILTGIHCMYHNNNNNNNNNKTVPSDRNIAMKETEKNASTKT